MTDRIWFSVAQAAEYASRHAVTVRNACIDKDLHGVQKKAGAHWRIHRDCLDAWCLGVTCPHGLGSAA